MRTVAISRAGRVVRISAVALIAAFSMFAANVQKANADDTYSMAPPISGDVNIPPDSGSVFNWKETPANQRVPLTRATFDKSGYQLYDTAGETILIPFTDDNLYVMKFAVSPDGTTFFENTGTAPVLYLPRDGYLVNQAGGGAQWYPFTSGFAPSTPVFIGCAPSWDAFIGLGWYPDECIYGGYWCPGPFFSAGFLTPTFGLFFSVGGERFFGFDRFRDFGFSHPAPFRTAFGPHDFRGFNGFHGGGFHGGSGFNGFRGGVGVNARGLPGSVRFRGASGGFGGREFGAAPRGHEFRGADGNRGFGGSAWHSGRESMGGAIHSSPSFHSFNGAGRSFGGGGMSGGFHGGGSPAFRGGNSGGGGFRGGNTGGGSRGGGGGGFHGGGDHHR